MRFPISTWLLVLPLALASGCQSKLDEYVCSSDVDCQGRNLSGRCEALQRCSFADRDCSGGQRYGEAAGEQSNTCVMALTDASTADSAPHLDAPVQSCDELFGSADGYQLCFEDKETCSFNVQLSGTSCSVACLALGSVCRGAFDNADGMPCVPVTVSGDTCETVRGNNICVCVR